MTQLDKEDIIIISVLTFLLFAGWYVIYQNLKRASLEECAISREETPINFLITDCRK